MNKRILFVTDRDRSSKFKSRARLGKRIYRSVYKKGVSYVNLKSVAFNYGVFSWLTRIVFLVKLTKRRRFSTIIFDGSNLGLYLLLLLPFQTKTVVFCHNCEAKFFFDKLSSRPNLKNVLIFIFTLISEVIAANFAAKLLVLTNIDQSLFRSLRFFKGPDILVAPFWVPIEEQSFATDDRIADLPCNYLLFVGSPFFANVDAVKWLIQNVGPRLELIDIVIAGDGMDVESLGLASSSVPERIHLVGRQDRLSPLYLNCIAVIAPIRSGSGKKTKIAEAFGYGKRVFGTVQAWAGYEEFCNIGGQAFESLGQLKEYVCSHDFSNDDDVSVTLRLIYADNFGGSSFDRRIAHLMLGGD